MWFLRSIAQIFENWIDPLALGDVTRPPNKIVGFFWHYLRQAKLVFLAMLVLDGLSALIEALFFFYIGRLIDILDGANQAGGWTDLLSQHGDELAMMLGVIVIGRFVVATLAALVTEQTFERGFYNLMHWQNYRLVAQQSVSFFNNQHSGSIATKVSQAGRSLGNVVTGLLQVVWTIAIFVVTTLTLFAQLDLRLAAVVMVWVVLFGFLARYFMPRMRKNATNVAEASAIINGRLVDSYANIQTLKLFGHAKDNDQYVRGGFKIFLAAARDMGRIVIGLRATMTLLSVSMIAIIGILAIDLWTQSLISVGAVAFTMALVLRLNMWFGRLMGGLNGLMRNFGVVQNAMETITRPIEVMDTPDAKKWEVHKGQIEFKNVSFQYAPSREIIENFNLSIEAGEKIGLVGHSGAGKTTMVNLLLRFYDLDSGVISIDGQDISAIKQESLRGALGVVTQDTALLHRSVRDNIAFGRANASQDEIEAAAKMADADEFIADLIDSAGRQGYDAYVGERGIKLSGGQRQRIAIARTMLKNAPILILDEATSALDSETEAAIQRQFENLMAGKTVIAIAHRLSTIAAMDRLVIMERGKIVEQGSHADLLKANGHYARLWARQSGGFLFVDPQLEAT